MAVNKATQSQFSVAVGRNYIENGQQPPIILNSAVI